MDAHIQEAKLCTDPFDQEFLLEVDVDLVLELLVEFGPSIHAWRQHQERVLRSLHGAFAPLVYVVLLYVPVPLVIAGACVRSLRLP
eukprot:3948471-Amphidinium_carterae.1